MTKRWAVLGLILAGAAVWLALRADVPAPNPTVTPDDAQGEETTSVEEAPALRAAGRDPEAVPAFETRGPLRIHVRVVDEQGRPVVGREVHLHQRIPAARHPALPRFPRWKERPAWADDERRHASTSTDDHGRASFDGLVPLMTYRATTLADAESEHGACVFVARGGQPEHELVVRTGARLSLQVLGPSGEGIRAHVHLRELRDPPVPDPRPLWMATAVAEEGAVAQLVPRGIDLVVEAHVPDVGVIRQPFRMAVQDARLTLRTHAERPVTLMGRVQDESGRGVPRAWLGVEVHRADGGSVRRWVDAQGDGSWRVAGLPEGTLQPLHAGAPDHARTRMGSPRRTLAAGDAVRLDVVLPHAGVVEGLVVDAENRPVPDVFVRVRPVGTLQGASTSFWATEIAHTDAKGAFRVPGVRIGSHVVEARGPGPARIEPVSVRVAHVGEVVRTRLLMPRGPRVRLRVVDGEGRPVPGAEVEVGEDPDPGVDPAHWRPSLERRGTFVSNHRGHVEVHVPPHLGPGVVRAHTRTTHSQQVLLPKGAMPEDVVLVLSPGHAVAGHVRTESGAPLSGVDVRVGIPGGWRVVQTGLDGAFRAEGLPAGVLSFDLRFVGREILAGPAPEGLRSDAPEARSVVLEVQDPVGISGVVLGPGDEPAEGVRIECVRESLRHVQVTSRSGRFHIWPLGPGMFELRGPGITSLFRKAGDDDVVLRFDPAQAPSEMFKGQVLLPNGDPVPQGVVSVAWAWSGEDDWTEKNAWIRHGRFEMDGVGPEVAHLRVRISGVADAFGRALDVLPFERLLDHRPEDLTLRLEPGLRLAGHVLDPEGRGVPDVEVACHGAQRLDGSRTRRETATDAQGAFVFVGLRRESHEILLRGLARHGFAPAPVQLHEAGVEGIRFRLQRMASVRGRVLGPGKVPVAGAMVTLRRSHDPGDGGTPTGWRTTTHADGTFRLTHIPQGFRGRLEVRPPKNREPALAYVDVERVRSGEPPMDVVLPEGLPIAGEIRFEGKRSWTHGRVALHPWTLTSGARPQALLVAAIHNGRFSTSHVPPGTYELRWRVGHALMPPVEPLRVAAGSDALEVPFTRGVGVHGRVASGGRVTTKATWLVGEMRFEARVQRGGGFHLEVPRDHAGVLLISCAESGQAARLPFDRPPGKSVDVELQPAPDIGGRLIGQWGPSTFGRIVAEGPVEASVMVNPDGTFRLRGLPPGGYILRARMDDSQRGTLVGRVEDVHPGHTTVQIQMD